MFRYIHVLYDMNESQISWRISSVFYFYTVPFSLHVKVQNADDHDESLRMIMGTVRI